MSDYLHGIEVVEINTGARPITTGRSSVIGLVGTAPAATSDFPLNTPVLVTGAGALAALGAGGTLGDALDAIWDQYASATIVIVRVEQAVASAATITNVVAGLNKLSEAEAVTGLAPKIIIAPGFSQSAAVLAEIKAVANRLRACGFVDGTDTTEAAAIAQALTVGSARVVSCDPWATAGPTNAPRAPSAVLAGVQARVDAELGFWHSASNKEVYGITGTTRVVGFGLSDPNTEANRLNEKGVMTIVARNGWRTWGGRTTSADPLWAFLSVRRTADMVYEAIEQAFLWAMAQPFSAQLLLDIKDSVEQYLRSLKARGAILGFKVWIDPELNTAASLMAGQLWVNFDLEPPGQLERLSFRAHRNGGYYDELVTAVAQAA